MTSNSTERGGGAGQMNFLLHISTGRATVA
ncbi:Protein of unknown function [Pyronema omphalodes CBS 100304]|uniref:Uncharacterized protein n=1 Tax=Pyronema omphalodes (strain CBS 100304) TaxID=1076935 RepID=U4LSQ8_PYROM|nr:Protein of unknown function [Pyronema omphalodes CBS 100304]